MAIKKYTDLQMDKLVDKTDWARVKKMRDRNIDFSDAPMAARGMLSGAVRHNLGRPVKDDKKVATNLRLDKRVIEGFKKTGPGWQTRINDSLLNSLKMFGLL
ncbi:MAG: BrnA antitoxin family protein [Rickettsiales bacterium]|nr:BrnA antitoxin family protein [Rickettsiales bacterium]